MTEATEDPKPPVTPIENLDLLPKKMLKKSRETIEAEVGLELAMCNGVYTPEDLLRWKKLGVNKPDFVTDAEWNRADRDLKPIHGIMTHLAAHGMSDEDIAKIVGTTSSTVRDTLMIPAARADVQRIQDMVWGGNVKKAIEKIIPVAIQTALQTMLDPKTKAQAKIDAAFRFMDRGMGRPVQQVELGDSLIRAVYEKLDGQNVIDITSKAKPEPEEAKVPEEEPVVQESDVITDVGIENWLKENIR